jgi:hypothetical protein
MVVLQLLAAGIILKIANVAKRKSIKSTSTETSVAVAGIMQEEIADTTYKTEIRNLDGQIKLGSIVIRDALTSQVLLLSNCGELHGNGDGFLALTAREADTRQKFAHNTKCVVDLVTADGVIIDRFPMLFDKRSFGNFLFTCDM